jgi:hypothetical protein
MLNIVNYREVETKIATSHYFTHYWDYFQKEKKITVSRI